MGSTLSAGHKQRPNAELTAPHLGHGGVDPDTGVKVRLACAQLHGHGVPLSDLAGVRADDMEANHLVLSAGDRRCQWSSPGSRFTTQHTLVIV